MAVRPFPIAVLFCAFSCFPLHAFAATTAGCKIGIVAELPVTMNGLRPMVTAKINGEDARFIADSGAFFSLIAPASAAEHKLRLKSAPPNFILRGVGGVAEAQVTTVKEFTLAGVPIHDVQFIVGGSEPGGGAVGLLGQNVLRLVDVEYDLANGAIRLMKPEGCDKKTVLAYWGKPGEPYSAIDIAWATAASPHTTSTAFLNETKIRILFDTGSSTSVLSLRAAERMGVTPDSEGVMKAGLSRGIGARGVQTYIAPFDSFKIGDEVVRHTKLRIGDFGNADADMLIGADFFLSHRIYVASSQRKLYFTYNGGPVFNLTSTPPRTVGAGSADPGGVATDSGHAPSGTAAPPDADAAAGPASLPVAATGPGAASDDNSSGIPGEPASPAKEAAAPPIPSGQPTDAAGFSRRGSAYAARRDFQHAIEDLSRACELAPTEPDYFFERARARLGNRQPALAMGDFDQAIRLKPDHIPARVARAALRLSRREAPGGEAADDAIADLDKASSVATKEADVRLEIGNLYSRAGALAQAIAQYDLWLDKHITEARTPDVLASRCRAKGLLGQDLDKALSDCNRAVKTRPDTGFFLDSRGLVYLRLGKLDKAIADYDAALRLQPKNPWALYGRGVAKLRKGMAAEGQADIAASKASGPRVAAEAARRGLEP
ncbi:MAG: aspartyl protease family protein [Gammaproteobacteria bacterium]